MQQFSSVTRLLSNSALLLTISALGACRTTGSTVRIKDGAEVTATARAANPELGKIVAFEYGNNIGSGVIIDDGWIVTNAHVAKNLGGYFRLKIRDQSFTVDQSKGYKVNIVMNKDYSDDDKRNDTAVLEFTGDYPGKGTALWDPVDFATKGVAIGDQITVVGWGNDRWSYTAGTLRYGATRVNDLIGDQHVIEVGVPYVIRNNLPARLCWNLLCFADEVGDVRPRPGDSGGAVFDRDFKLVGLIVAGTNVSAIMINLQDAAGRWLANNIRRKIPAPGMYDDQKRPLPSVDGDVSTDGAGRGDAIAEGKIIDAKTGVVVYEATTNPDA